jgi:predicted lipoprotein with Yx(FWY)xxD motif
MLQGTLPVRAIAIAPFLAALALLVGCSTVKPADVAPLSLGETPLGTVMTDAHGMTLYTLTSDEDGESTCYSRCAKFWPPATAENGAQPNGPLTIVMRKDGLRQWAYDGKPLYRWHKDKKPGDTTGNKIGDVWFVARP